MNPKNLKDLFAFAKVKGLTSMSEIVEEFMKTKMYRRPRVEIYLEMYRKREMSYEHMQKLVDRIIQRKDRLHKLFGEHGIECNIVIGGSISLRYQCKEFSNRDFHDIDLIVYPSSEEAKKKLQSFLIGLMSIGLCSSTSEMYIESSTSFILGQLKFYGELFPVNIIIGETKYPLPFEIEKHFNSPQEVIDAKLNYIENAGFTRLKDYIDCDIYMNNNL